MRSYLAGAGVGTIGIIDPDYIELSNLSRQLLYRLEDVGQQKVIIVQRQLLQLNPELNVLIYPEYLILNNALELIKSFDIIADCTDNFKT